jgi:hypothetical protein
VMDLESRIVDELFPGSMDDEQARAADKKLGVHFYMHFVPDHLATDGGYLEADFNPDDPKRPLNDEIQDRIDELVKLGCKFKRLPKTDGVVKVLPLGRPVYRTVEFIRIMKPGDRDNIIEQPLDDEYRERFKERYDKWREAHDNSVLGTPLEELPFITAAMREELKFFHIYTAEDLANIADRDMQKFPNGLELRKRAARYLEAAEKKAPFDEVHQEIKMRDEKISEMQATIEAMKAQLTEFQTGPRKGSSKG